MEIIFAIDEKWNIGYKGDMLFRIKEDLNRFKEITKGNILIMGRMTFEALPNKKPLEDRTNIIITRDKNYLVEGAYVIHSVDELFPLLALINEKKDKKEFLIGGANLVNQLIDHCDYAYITKVYKTFKLYDTSLYNLDEDDRWEIVKKSALHRDAGVDFQYLNYERMK